ncbi:MAG: PAS domain S-box protein [Promethearchaeota archaeon]
MSDAVDKSTISEQKFKALFKGTSFPSYVWKIIEDDLILIEYNNSAAKITDGRIKDYLGCKASEIYKDQFEFYEGLYQCAFSRSNVFKEIKSICTTSGEEKFKSVNYSYIPPDLVLVLTEDITERKRIEQKLKKSEEKYKSIAEFFPDIIYEIDKSGKLSYVNPMGYETFGYQKDEVIGKMSMIQFVVPEQRGKLIQNAKRFFSGELIEPDIYTFQKKDGAIFYGRVHSRPIYKEGKIVGIRGVLHDVHKLIEIKEKLKKLNLELEQRVEERTKKLKESEEKFYKAFNSNALSMSISSINDGRFIEVNDVFLNDLGLTREEVIGKSSKELNLWVDENQRDEMIRNIEGKGSMSNFHVRFRTKSGEIRQGLFSVSKITLKNKPYLLNIVNDITEYREAGLKLKDSEQKYSAIVNAFDGLIYICSQDYIVEFMNENFIQRTGYDGTGEACFKALHNLNNICPWCVNDRVFSGETVRWEVQSPKDNHWFYVVNTPINHPDGSISKMGMIMDITERKQIEEKLRRSEERYRTLVETMTDGLAVIDENNCFTYVNISFSKMIGYSYDELLGTYVFNYLDKRNQQKVEYEISKRKKGEAEPYELVWTHKNGQKVYTIMAPKPLYDNGNYIGAFAVITNITQRIIAEQHLRDSEEKYRRLFENSPEAIMLTNMDGFVLDINSAAEKIFGLGKNEVTGRYYYQFEIFNSDQIAIIKNRILDLSLGKQKKFEEFKIKRKDGSSLWVLFQASIIKLRNEPCILSIAQDITEKKKAETIIEKELIKLKELDDIKNELITRASHELKTPLTSILGSAELFLKLYKGVYTDEMKQLIKIIYKGGKRLENLVKNTIDISLMESKSISFRKEKEDIGKLIDECVNDLISLADKRELSLECNLQENIFIHVDKNKIIQVIKNVISNAIQNTPPKGKVSINLKKMKKNVEISIKDTGVGLSETELQRIFQKFGKIERYGKDYNVDIEGPGLGLYLAKKIIEMHEGKIWAESEGLNKGATFIIELPVN